MTHSLPADDTPRADLPGQEPPAPKRRGWLVWLLAGALALALALAAFFALRPTRTEAGQADRTVLTEKVEKRALAAKVVTRGTVGSVGATSVSCAPSQAGVETQVFTRNPEVGKRLKEGEVLAAVNGRPVLILQSTSPAFRDMLPGSTGTDVAQLQAALGRLGYGTKDASGTFGSSTQEAVSKWYAALGFVAKQPTPEEAGRLRAARDAVAQAQAGVTAAEAALAEAKKGPAKSAVLGAELAVKQAKDQVATAKTTQEKSVATKQLAIAEAQLEELNQDKDLTAVEAAYDAAIDASRPGKSAVASDQLGLALRPDQPTLLNVEVPPAPELTRQLISSDTQALLVVLGVISLVIGGVGIANMTLVSVLQRVPEIGLRRAIGASRTHIIVQFLCGTTITGLIGGIVGTLVGVLATFGLTAVQGWPSVVPPLVVVLGPFAGALIGLVAGLYPARRASRIEPIDALRA